MLNEKQQLAAQIIEGPALVIAGPGTGKTHLLSHRVANLLMETDVDPSNILCLTFSDAGVSAMRRRLRSVIGEAGNKVHVFTFHGFCNKVIQENLDFMGVGEMEPATDVEKIEVIRSLISGTSPDNPLNKATGRVFFYEKHLAHLFSWIKRENEDPQYVKRITQEWIDKLEENPEFQYKRNSKYGKAGDPNKNKIAEESERMERLLAGLELYPKYNKTMERRGLYDYDDMIRWVLAAFGRGENLLRRYQEQYLYILVDEFQDTNGAQFDLVKTLASFWETPNLFIVGDDDQSVFEFQGARIKNVMDFIEEYRPEVVVLDKNYRSGQRILDAAKDLIRKNFNRLEEKGFDKDIHADNPFGNVCKWSYETTDQMGSALLGFCRDGGDESIAIIYSKHRQVFDLIKAFQNSGVKFSARYTNDVFRTTSWKYIESFFEYVALEDHSTGKGDFLLFDWMHYQMFGMSRQQAVLAAKNLRIKSVQLASDSDIYVKPYFVDYPDMLSPALADFAGNIVQSYHAMTLIEWYDWMIRTSGLLAASKGNTFELAVIRTVWDYIQAQSMKNAKMTIHDLVSQFKAMRENNVPLRVNVARVEPDAIELVSAHAAKGLEWDHVVMWDCSSSWEPGRQNSQFKLPPGLTFSGDEDAMEASRRAWYVAMTRAKSNLYLVRAEVAPNGKDIQPALFWDEVPVQEQKVEVSQEKADEYSALLLGGEREQLELSTMEIDELLETFQLSPTSINEYLTCPLSFFYKYLLKVPYFESDTIQFGYAIHDVLATIFRKQRHNKDRSFHRVEYLVQWFQDYMNKHRSKFSKEGYPRLFNYGEKVLEEYYQHHVQAWPTHTQAEYRVSHLVIDGAPMMGVIDRMDFVDHYSCIVTDYKTGKYRPADFETPSEDNPHGGKYWRQMGFYKILVDADPREDWTATGARISFVEKIDGRFRDIDVDVSQTDYLRGLIRQVWGGIKSYDFHGCGDPECKYCNL